MLPFECVVNVGMRVDVEYVDRASEKLRNCSHDWKRNGVVASEDEGA